MADKLDWLGRHLVLIRRRTVAEAVSGEAYEIPPELEDLFDGAGGAEETVFKLAGLGKHRNACELLAYTAHRRAAVWWGYRCVCSLREELRQKPPEEIDPEKPPEDPPIPPYFNIEIPKPDPALMAGLDAALAKAKGEAAAVPVEAAMKKYVAGGVERAFAAFEKANGVHPMALLKQLGEGMKRDPYAISPDSPIFKLEKELHEKYDGQRERVLAEIKEAHAAAGLESSLNKIPQREARRKKLALEALDAVYAWVAAPDAGNTQRCLDAGNTAKGPEGDLAQCAFWAYGDLAPQLEQVVPTPPGLAANGLDKLLLTCALTEGGTRKIAERYEHYFALGVEVISGRDNWEDSLAGGEPPHRILSPAEPVPGDAAPEPAENQPEKPAGGSNGGYKRWKPEAE